MPKYEPDSKYGNPRSYVVFGRRYYTKTTRKGHIERGIASWYGKKFHGRKTSSGERYNMYAMTAAHKSLPLPTYAQVTNLTNGRSAVVKINDRGPFHGRRIIDLSYSAARKLRMANRGTAPVEVKTIVPDAPKRKAGPKVAEQSGQTAGSSLYLQVGAFGDRMNAEYLRRRLANQLTERVRVREAKTDKTPRYKVRVGPLDSHQSASDLSRRLASLGLEKSHTVVE